MKIQIAAANSQTVTNAVEVPPKMLEPGNLYTAVTYNMDDSGDTTLETDIVSVQLDTIEGKKNIRVIKFLLGNKVKRFAQIPGTRFFGPITLGILDQHAPTVVDGPNIDDILAKASLYQGSTNGAAAVNDENVVLPTAVQQMVEVASTCPGCGRKNATLQTPNGDEPPMYWCNPMNGGCDEIWEQRL